MVADNLTLPQALDPTESLQGDVGHCLQVFRILKHGVIQHPKTKRSIREWLITDQFGNVYITFMAILGDGETYQWPDGKAARVKPSVIADHGGLSGDLFDKYRTAAFQEFTRTNAAIKALRHVADATAGKVVDFGKLELNLPPKPDIILPGQ